MSKTDFMEYREGMEKIDSDIMDRVLSEVSDYDYNVYNKGDVLRVLDKEYLNHQEFTIKDIWFLKDFLQFP